MWCRRVAHAVMFGFPVFPSTILCMPSTDLWAGSHVHNGPGLLGW